MALVRGCCCERVSECLRLGAFCVCMVLCVRCCWVYILVAMCWGVLAMSMGVVVVVIESWRSFRPGSGG